MAKYRVHLVYARIQDVNCEFEIEADSEERARAIANEAVYDDEQPGILSAELDPDFGGEVVENSTYIRKVEVVV